MLGCAFSGPESSVAESHIEHKGRKETRGKLKGGHMGKAPFSGPLFNQEAMRAKVQITRRHWQADLRSIHHPKTPRKCPTTRTAGPEDVTTKALDSKQGKSMSS